jgi:hypothetical protein
VKVKTLEISRTGLQKWWWWWRKGSPRGGCWEKLVRGCDWWDSRFEVCGDPGIDDGSPTNAWDGIESRLCYCEFVVGMLHGRVEIFNYHRALHMSCLIDFMGRL